MARQEGFLGSQNDTSISYVATHLKKRLFWGSLCQTWGRGLAVATAVLGLGGPAAAAAVSAWDCNGNGLPDLADAICILQRLATPAPPPSPGGSGNTATVWSMLYGGEGAEEMEGLAATPDGGFLVAGTTDSFGEADTGDGLVVKVASDGRVAWARTYGGPADDMLIDIQPTADNGAIAAGWTKSFGAGQADFWVVKIDAAGEIVWQKAYGGKGMEQAWSVVPLADGGCVVAGGTTSFGAGKADYWLLRLDATGEIVWQKAYGGAGDDAPGGTYEEYVARVVRDRDGFFVLASETDSFGHGDTDVWVVKVRPEDGGIAWQKAYGDTNSDTTWSIRAMPEGGYLVPGMRTDPQTQEPDLWVLRLATDGSVTWQQTYGVANKTWDEALAAASTRDGGALVAGYYEKGPSDWYGTLVRLAADGSLLWQRQFKYGDLDWPNAVLELADGGYAMAGVSTLDLATTGNQELWLMRLDQDGRLGSGCTVLGDLDLVTAATATTPVGTNATVTTTTATVTVTTAQARAVTLAGRECCTR